MKFSAFSALLCTVLITVFACSDEPLPSNVTPPAEDLIPFTPDDGKADGYGFNQNLILEDIIFEDKDFLTQTEIQSFLEFTPYQRRSFLADHVDEGKLVSQHLFDAAQAFRINPLVLLTKLQVESSVVYKDTSPQDSTVDWAMGCGCHDGDPNCSRGPKGVGPQIHCAARLFRSYLDEIDAADTTRSGWRVSRSKTTLDDIQITPRNRATAALYTYTPWVLQGRGGNWLFWNVYHRFARQLLANKPNHRFIGGPCRTDEDCVFEEGLCAFKLSNDRDALGVCTQPCERTCPDRQQPHTSVTFCMDSPEGGLCVARCDDRLFANTDGCDLGLMCVQANRPNDLTRTQDVCAPTDPEG